MSKYARSWVPGGTFFFTLVTASRKKVFASPAHRRSLREAFRQVLAERPVETVAFVLLPEHLHCIWTLPEGDAGYSIRWKLIKERFSKAFLSHGGKEAKQSDSKTQRGERGVWQRRFWEHTVRDEVDLERLCDYIHYNPVKHGLVKCPYEWPHSTFHRFVDHGLYPRDWACHCEKEKRIASWMVSNDFAGE